VAQFYLDQDVDLRLGALLARHGHPTQSTRDHFATRRSDDQQLLFAAQRGWTLITHNGKDFELLHYAWCRWAPALGMQPFPPHAGILVIPQKARQSTEDTVERILSLLAQGGSLANMLYWWKFDLREWAYVPP
jgi:hypothetical protein